MRFYVISASFALGIAAGLLLSPTLFGLLALLLLVSAILVYVCIFIPQVVRTKFLIIPFISLALLLGIIRTTFISPLSKSLDSFVGTSPTLKGIITDEPDMREDYTKLIIKIESVNDKILAEKVTVLAEVPRYPEFQYGDEINLVGKIKLPENFETDTGRTFDYVTFLRKDGIQYLVSYAKPTPISSGHGNIIRREMLVIKKKFVNGISSAFSEPEASLLAGIILGSKHGLGDELNQEFRTAGLSHIVVLSGYNITIVSEWTRNFLTLFLSRTFALFGGAIGILLFVFAAGGSASVIRAALMAFIAILGKVLGRRYDALRALTIVGVGMILWNPFTLLFDPSFQLSFLATLALIIVSPLTERRITFVTKKFGLREIVATTISVQIFVLPLILYMNGVLSLASFPANILVLPLMPLLMLLGFGTAIIALIVPTIGAFVGLPTFLLLSYILKVVHIASMNLFTLTLPAFGGWVLIPIYCGYALLIYRMKQRESTEEESETVEIEISQEALSYEIIE